MDWHVLRHERLLREITKGRTRGNPTGGRRRIQMLDDLANDGFVALKWAAEVREEWMSKTCSIAKDC